MRKEVEFICLAWAVACMVFVIVYQLIHPPVFEPVPVACIAGYWFLALAYLLRQHEGRR